MRRKFDPLLRIQLIELAIDAMEWLRCRLHGWIGRAYLLRDRLALRAAMERRP